MLGFEAVAEITPVFEADPGGRVEDEPGGAGCRRTLISLGNPDC